MEKKIEKVSACTYEIKLVPTKDEWGVYIEKAYKKLQEKVEIPGFRKGKAPENLLKGKVSTGDAMDEALNSLFQEQFAKIVKEEKMSLAEQPEITIQKASLDELELLIKVVVEPVITLGKYKGLEVEKELIVVVDDDIDEKIIELQAKNAELVVKEKGKVENNDTVIIDFEGFLNDVPFEGGKASKFQLEIGSNSFVPGFEEQIIGMENKEEKDIKITFPKDYTPELAGKEVIFKVVLHEIKSKVLPKIDDELALDANFDEVATLDELKEHYRNELFATKEKEAENETLKKVIDLIVKNSQLEMSESFLDRETETRINHIKEDLVNKKVKFEEYLESNKLTEETFKQQIRKQSKDNIIFAFVIINIAKNEKISISEKEVDDALTNIATMYGQTLENIKETLKDRLYGFKQEMLFNKVYEFLKKENNITK